MDNKSIDEIVAKTNQHLKDFQSKTVELIYEKLYVEPALTFRFGSDIKIQTQFLFSGAPNSYLIEEEYFEFSSLGPEAIHISFGVFVPLDLNQLKD